MAYSAISKRLKRKALDLSDSNVLKQFLSDSSPEVPSGVLEGYAEPLSEEITEQPIFRTPNELTDLDESTRQARQGRGLGEASGLSTQKRVHGTPGHRIGRRLHRSEGEVGLLEPNGVSLMQKILESLTELKGQTVSLTEKQEEGFKHVNERIDTIREEVQTPKVPETQLLPAPIAGKRRHDASANSLSRWAHQLYNQSDSIQFDVHSGSINSRLNVDAVNELVEALQAKWGDRYDSREYKVAVSKVYRRKRQEANEQSNGKETENKRKRKLNNRRWRKLCDRKSVCETEEEREFWEPVCPELMSDDEEGEDGKWVTLKHSFRSPILNVKCRIMDGRLIGKGRQAKRHYVNRTSTRERKQQYSDVYVVPN